MSGRHGIEVEFACGDGDGVGVGLGVTFGVSNQEGKVGQVVQASGKAVAGAVEGGECLGCEQGSRGTGRGQPAQNVSRRFGFGERAKEATGGEAVGQTWGKLQDELGRASCRERV